MRIPLGKLLAGSPFSSLAEFMARVIDACETVPELIDHLIAGDQEAVLAAAKEASRKEGEADEHKRALRDRLPKTLFMPIDRRDLLQLIGEMDSMADCAEDLGVILTIRRFDVPEPMTDLLRTFVERIMAVAHQAAEVIGTLDDLLAAGFGGSVAAKTRALTDDLGRKEHEADKIQDQLAKVLFQLEDELSPVSIFMWNKVLNKLGDIANHAENVGDRIRLFLAR